MRYILIGFDNGDHAYQEILNGYVTRITSLTGETLEGATLTSMGGSYVIDDNPPQPAWAQPDPQPEPQPEPVPATNIITKLAYMNRFQDGELAAIFTAAKTEVMIEVWLEKFKAAQEIDLSDPETMAGVQALEAFGLIGEGRAGEILNA